MKKLLFILLGAFAFSCGGNNTEQNRDANTIPEAVQTGAGEEQNPQLKLDGDSAGNFEVDTVSSAADINERQQ